MSFANRVNQIQPSQTLAVTALVDKLRREGRDVIDLGAGEPDFETPALIQEAAVEAIHRGYTKYTPSTGTAELKEAICEKLAKDNNLNYSPADIIVTCGAKHALFNVLLALCERGDEVILQSPYWTSYVEQIRFVDAEPVILKTDENNDFKISAEQLRSAVTERTKLVIINSPSNPTGAVYTSGELSALAEVIDEAGCYVLSDKIYEKIIYGDSHHESLVSLVDSKESAIVVNGVSKAYSMTGWRIGYLAASADVVKAAAKIQSHSTSNPSSISQHASIAALRADPSIVKQMVTAFDERREFLLSRLSSIPGMICSRPQGAFYLFPKVAEYFGTTFNNETIRSSSDFCSFLLRDQGVALVPGEAFGCVNNVRISYATSMENLREAVSRIARGLQKLRDGN
ncbi:pyridoxal phosphate-dependent aminotransferase [bacterium]|nr:pyridoxal phosphate-dependent aminotransferase [bacterium]